MSTQPEFPNNKVKISDNALRKLFQLNYTSKESFNINYILQIVHIAKYNDLSTSNSNKELYTATLADSTHKYNGFVFIKESDSINLQESNLINILQVSPIICANQPSRVFVIKKYNIINNESISIPIQETKLVKDDKGQVLFGDEEDELILDEEQMNLINNEMNSNSNNSIDNNNDKNSQYTPLKELTSFTKEFRLFVGIISKTEKKYYNSSQGNPGCLFSFIIIDEHGSEMEVTGFNQMVDKYYDKIKVNHTYEIIDGSVRRAQKSYNAYLSTDYKIILENNSIINEKEDKEKLIKLPSIKNTLISDIASLPLYSSVNILCMVIKEGERIMKKTKSGERPMRIITVADASQFKIELTLWGNFANQPLTKDQILQLNSVKIGDFNGRNISTINESHISINPNTQEATELKLAIASFEGKFKDISTEGASKNIIQEMNELNSSSAPIKIEFISEVLDSIDEIVETNNLTRIKATITRLVHNDKNFYPGCPERNCKKKLIQNFSEWICLVCDKKYAKPTYYFTLSLRVKDCSCEQWLDIFGKTAENLLKLTAEEYKEALYDRESTKLRQISNELEFKDFIFVIKPKIQMFNSTPKKKLSVYRIDPVNGKDEMKRLLTEVKTSLKL